MLNIIWVKFKDYKNSMPMIIVMTVMALVLIYIFGQSFDGGYLPKVAVVNSDKTPVSISFIEQMMSMDGYEFEMTTFEEGKGDLENSQYIALIRIEEGFGSGIVEGESAISFYKSGDSIEHQTLRMNIESIGRLFTSNEAFATVMAGAFEMIGEEVDKSEMHATITENRERFPIMTFETKAHDNRQASGFESIKHSFMGYILFFSMFTMVFGVGSLVEEKENRVWQRQLVSPLKPSVVLAGNMIASFIVGMLQLGFMMLFSKYVFGINFGGSILVILLVLACYVVAITCLGLLLSNMVKTSQQLGSFSPVIIVGTSMIGGCMWPLSIITSDFLLFLADLTPQRWAYLGLKAIMVNNGSFGDVVMPMTYLLIIAAVLFGLAMIPYQKALKATT